jgi:hypothetical protein
MAMSDVRDAGIGRFVKLLLLGLLFAGSSGAVHAQCDPTPYLAGVGLTDLNRNPVASVSANTEYFIKVCARSASVCVNLTGGGQFVGRLTPDNACNDVTFPSPYTEGDVGETFFRVRATGPGFPITGVVTPWDACTGAQPQYNLSFSLPNGTVCSATSRRYVCGYALPGYNCNNGRRSASIQVSSMSVAIPQCRNTRPAGYASYTDFCYVIDADGAAPTDSTQCAAAGGSWRPKNNCCNFKGTLSCPW